MQPNISATIPPSIIEAATAMLKPYGVDIVAALTQHPEAVPPAVESLKKKYLTTAEAVQYCGIGRWALWKAVQDGKIKASKLADARCGRVLYDRASLDAWLESRMKQPKQQPEA